MGNPSEVIFKLVEAPDKPIVDRIMLVFTGLFMRKTSIVVDGM